MAHCLTRLMPTIRASSGTQSYSTARSFMLARRGISAACFSAPLPVHRPVAPEWGRMQAASSAHGALASDADKPKVIILTGATGVGKTELSLTLAESLNGEIVSADSVQVITPICDTPHLRYLERQTSTCTCDRDTTEAYVLLQSRCPQPVHAISGESACSMPRCWWYS